LNLVEIGRNNFYMDRAETIESLNLKVVPGLLETIYMGSAGLTVNVDTIMKSIRTITVLDQMYEMRSRSKDEKQFQRKFQQEVTNTIVMCCYNNKTVHIDGVEWRKTPKEKFERRGKLISLAEYYLEQYNIKLKDLDQPLLTHQPKDANHKVEYFIPELCVLTGLTPSLKLDWRALESIKKVSAQLPDKKAAVIYSIVKSNLQHKDYKKLLDDWGYNIDPRMISVDGRVLPMEKVQFKNKELGPDPTYMTWRLFSMYKSGPQVKEYVVVFPPDQSDMDFEFIKILLKQFQVAGLQTNEQNMVKVVAEGYSDLDYVQTIKKAVTKSTGFVVVLLPDDDSRRYSAVKEYLCLKFPIPSQCIQRKTYDKGKALEGKAQKIAIQIGSKIGAVPWIVDLKMITEPTMIIGMDVYHSGEIVKKTKSSICAFIATLDSTATSFYSRLVEQAPGKEITEALEPVFLSALNVYKTKNGKYPKQIIFYRDGVGESMVSLVQKSEISSLEKVMKQLNISIPMCYIVTLKRIHSRLFALNSDGLGNPQSGSIVDSGITHRGAMEFFLVAQFVTQGTAVPVKYQCLVNTANLSMEFLQELTFKLCHLYFNWNGPIRVPHTCQLAHKYAFLRGESLSREDPTEALASLPFYL